MADLNIVNVGYESTNYYVLADSKPRLLIDVGMPGTLAKLQHQCKRAGVNLAQIPYLICTHYHPDHAGIAQEVKRLGPRLIVVETQPDAISRLAPLTKSQAGFVPITLNDNLNLSLADSRAFLASMSIHGEIIATPGHSEDSITLILDQGIAFTGDLIHPTLIEADASNPGWMIWQRIRSAGVRQVYPGHGPVQELARRFPIR